MTKHAILRYPSPIHWLADHLAQAISILSPETSIDLPPLSTNLRQFGTLASPVLLKLASIEQGSGGRRSPQEIGAALIEQLSGQIGPTNWLRPEFAIQPSGWLYVHFSGTELSKWLQTLLSAKPELHWLDPPVPSVAMTPGMSEDPVLFQLQYAHARCCSLLRLAQQTNIVERVGTDFQIATTNISWHTAESLLRLQNPSETKLLLALMEFPRSFATVQKYTLNIAENCTDATIVWPIPERDLQAQAQFWGDLFLNFYGECRILGDIQTRAPDLAQARSALIYITQTILVFLLEKIFLVEAPEKI